MVKWQIFNDDYSTWDCWAVSFGASFYQSYAWGEFKRLSGWSPIRVFASNYDHVSVMASILVKDFGPFSVCWVPGGPSGDLDALGNEFQSFLKQCLNGRLVYIRLGFLETSSDRSKAALEKNHWSASTVKMSSGRKMLYSLIEPEANRLKNASANWRHNLKRAGKHDLKLSLDENPDTEEVLRLYAEMGKLKNISMPYSAIELQALFEMCSGSLINVSCRNLDGQLMSFRSAAIFGSSALDFLAVTGLEGRKNYASHATLWALLNHCQKIGLTAYDMSGVDPEKNAGVFHFKKGAGAELVDCLGEYEWASLYGLKFGFNFILNHR